MFDDIKNYINKRITITKYEFIDSISNVVAFGVFGLLLAIIILCFILILGIALGIFIGLLCDNFYIGIAVVLLLYISLISFLIFKKELVIGMITDVMIANVMKTIQDKEEEKEREREENEN